jgi:hypothetical protein
VTCADWFSVTRRSGWRAGTGDSRTMELLTLHRLSGGARACRLSITRVLGRRGVGPLARRRPRAGAAQRVPRRAGLGGPRDPRGRRYSLAALLAIAVLAVAAGMRGYAGFATWAHTAPEDVLAQLGIRFRRPSEKTFRTVLSQVGPPKSFARCGRHYHRHLSEEDPWPPAFGARTLGGGRWAAVRGMKRVAPAGFHACDRPVATYRDTVPGMSTLTSLPLALVKYRSKHISYLSVARSPGCRGAGRTVACPLPRPGGVGHAARHRHHPRHPVDR